MQDPPSHGGDGQGNGVEVNEPPPTTPSVQETLESMLSKKNLVRDGFLASSMNPQMYIDIEVLLEHERLKIIGATEETIVEAAVRSAKLGINEPRTMVRPLLKSKRNVIILRDLPVGTTEEQLREFFKAAPHAEKLSSVKPEVNNTWFVKFSLDDGIQDVVLWLRSQTFQGHCVNAAIKSEHFLRSFFPSNVATSAVDYPGPSPVPGGFNEAGFVGTWAAESANLPPPHPFIEGPQMPGYWQPWGSRFQPPALIFETETKLEGCELPEQPKVEVPNDDDEGGKAKGKGKGGKGKAKGWDKGGCGKGKESNAWYNQDGGGKGWSISSQSWYNASTSSGQVAGSTWANADQEQHSRRKGNPKIDCSSADAATEKSNKAEKWVPKQETERQVPDQGHQ